jgi:hypothetical protein
MSRALSAFVALVVFAVLIVIGVAGTYNLPISGAPT